MGIDRGPSIVQTLITKGYIKPNTSGYLFTKEGIEWLSNEIQELYYLSGTRSPKFPESSDDISES